MAGSHPRQGRLSSKRKPGGACPTLRRAVSASAGAQANNHGGRIHLGSAQLLVLGIYKKLFETVHLQVAFSCIIHLVQDNPEVDGMAKALQEYRRRQAPPGLQRVELSVPIPDADLLRRVAAALANNDHKAERVRLAIQCMMRVTPADQFKDWLASLADNDHG